MTPSAVRIVRESVMCAVASTIEFPRSLPTRSMSVGTHSIGALTALFENATRPIGRANFEKTSPVASAVTIRLTTDSATTRLFAPADSGYIAPYPIVPMVCTLK